MGRVALGIRRVGIRRVGIGRIGIGRVGIGRVGIGRVVPTPFERTGNAGLFAGRQSELPEFPIIPGT